MGFELMDIYEVDMNPFRMIGKDWFLLTNGDENGYNTMTASWGQMGVLWGNPTFTCVVRPTRKTFEFMEKNDLFTISFFSEDYRSALNFCGSHSGREYDKAKETGLTPFYIDGSVAFEQANTIFVCRKVYTEDLCEESIIDKKLLKFYEKDPFHKAFAGEIIGAYKKS